MHLQLCNQKKYKLIRIAHTTDRTDKYGCLTCDDEGDPPKESVEPAAEEGADAATDAETDHREADHVHAKRTAYEGL